MVTATFDTIFDYFGLKPHEKGVVYALLIHLNVLRIIKGNALQVYP